MFDVQWEDAILPNTPTGHSIVHKAHNRARLLTCKKDHNHGPFSPDTVFNQTALDCMISHVDSGKCGKPFVSNDEGKDDPPPDGNVPGTSLCRSIPEVEDFIESRASQDTKENTHQNNNGQLQFKWHTDKSLNPPVEKANKNRTKVKPKFVGEFKTATSSFVAFVPVKIFQTMDHHLNKCAHEVMKEKSTCTISGTNWNGASP